MGAANAASSHPHPINLAFGEPAEDPAPAVKEAAIRAVRDGLVRYSPASGLPRLRELIARDQWRKSGLERDVDEIIVTPGGKPALLEAMCSLLGQGDEALVLAPYWPTYLEQVALTGARAVILDPDAELLPDVAAIEAACTPRTKVLVLNDPCNPTSLALAPERLRAIAEVADRHDLWILADQVYDDLLLDGEHRSLLRVAPELGARTIVVESFSKRFAMTGYRLGYACGPVERIESMARMATASTTCANTVAQHAGIAALAMDDTWIEEQRIRYRRRRDLVLARLAAIRGLRWRTPAAAFYLFPATDRDDVELVAALREQEGVLLVPGDAFGAPGHVRISYSTADELLEEALDRIQRFLAK